MADLKPLLRARTILDDIPQVIPRVQSAVTSLVFNLLSEVSPFGYETTKRVEVIKKPEKLQFKICLTIFRKDIDKDDNPQEEI